MQREAHASSSSSELRYRHASSTCRASLPHGLAQSRVAADSEVTALYADVDMVGQIMGSSKIKYTWVLEIRNIPYRIEFLHSKVSGKKKLFVNGTLKEETAVSRASQYNYDWLIESHLLCIVYSPVDSNYHLTVDGRPYSSFRHSCAVRRRERARTCHASTRVAHHHNNFEQITPQPLAGIRVPERTSILQPQPIKTSAPALSKSSSTATATATKTSDLDALQRRLGRFPTSPSFSHLGGDTCSSTRPSALIYSGSGKTSVLGYAKEELLEAGVSPPPTESFSSSGLQQEALCDDLLAFSSEPDESDDVPNNSLARFAACEPKEDQGKKQDANSSVSNLSASSSALKDSTVLLSTDIQQSSSPRAGASGRKASSPVPKSTSASELFPMAAISSFFDRTFESRLDLSSTSLSSPSSVVAESASASQGHSGDDVTSLSSAIPLRTAQLGPVTASDCASLGLVDGFFLPDSSVGSRALLSPLSTNLPYAAVASSPIPSPPASMSVAGTVNDQSYSLSSPDDSPMIRTVTEASREPKEIDPFHDICLTFLGTASRPQNFSCSLSLGSGKNIVASTSDIPSALTRTHELAATIDTDVIITGKGTCTSALLRLSQQQQPAASTVITFPDGHHVSVLEQTTSANRIASAPYISMIGEPFVVQQPPSDTPTLGQSMSAWKWEALRPPCEDETAKTGSTAASASYHLDAVNFSKDALAGGAHLLAFPCSSFSSTSSSTWSNVLPSSSGISTEVVRRTSYSPVTSSSSSLSVSQSFASSKSCMYERPGVPL